MHSGNLAEGSSPNISGIELVGHLGAQTIIHSCKQNLHVHIHHVVNNSDFIKRKKTDITM